MKFLLIILFFILNYGVDRVAPETPDMLAGFPQQPSEQLLIVRSNAMSSQNYSTNFNGTGKRHPLYSVLHHIKDRCYNQNDKRYIHYGGRGIIVCDEWRNDYEVFIKWALNNGWKNGLAIDRINNDGNYEPSNCRFITLAENNRNQRLIRKNNTSGYRCVQKSGRKWISRITINSKAVHLGTFISPRLAALRYDAEVCLLNDGRPMNFIESTV